MRKHAFWFHFNKPRSRAAGKPQISVHQDGVCHIVDNVICRVTTTGRIRKQQPQFVVTGRASLTIRDGVAHLS